MDAGPSLALQRSQRHALRARQQAAPGDGRLRLAEPLGPANGIRAGTSRPKDRMTPSPVTEVLR
jgi:hypothetical protein